MHQVVWNVTEINVLKGSGMHVLWEMVNMEKLLVWNMPCTVCRSPVQAWGRWTCCLSRKEYSFCRTLCCHSMFPRKFPSISCACSNDAVVVVCVFALFCHVFCSVMRLHSNVSEVLKMMLPFPVQYACRGFYVHTQKIEDVACFSVTADPPWLCLGSWNRHAHWENCLEQDLCARGMRVKEFWQCVCTLML